jgi:hypothetical protein
MQLRKENATMKRIIPLLLLLALLMVTTTAAAPRQPIGERINLYIETDFPENTPFHITHGWRLSFDSKWKGSSEFQLEVDGVVREDGFVIRRVDRTIPDFPLSWMWVFNFPEGMTGTHVFTGRWFMACQSAVEAGMITGPCSNPAQKVETNSRTLIVEFVP